MKTITGVKETRENRGIRERERQKGKIVNPSYKPHSRGNPYQVILDFLSSPPVIKLSSPPVPIYTPG